jgi:hypothetical protein
MAKKITLEQWLNKKQSWFFPNDFEIVKNVISKLDEEAFERLCSKKIKLKNIVNSVTGSNLWSLCSPKMMLVFSIFGMPPEVQFTMHSMYSVLIHWLWYLLTPIKICWWLILILGISNSFSGEILGILAGIIVTAWYVYDIITVKKRTRKYNFKVFCYATGYSSSVSETVEPAVQNTVVEKSCQSSQELDLDKEYVENIANEAALDNTETSENESGL